MRPVSSPHESFCKDTVSKEIYSQLTSLVVVDATDLEKREVTARWGI